MRKVLLTDKPNIGNLSEFIDLLAIIQKEFKYDTKSINAIDTNNRNMNAQLEGKLGLLVLDYDYNYQKFYISIDSYKEDVKETKKVKSLIKELVEK